MLNKTNVLGAAIAVTLLMTGPGAANVEASFVLRPAFDSSANWLKPASTLAAAELRNELGHRHVFRIAPHPNEPDLVPPLREAGILVDRSLTFGELDRQFAKGAHIVSTTADELPRSGGTETDVPLFAVTLDGQLSVAADGHRPDLRLGNTVIVLALAYSSDPAPEKVRELAREETET